METDPGNGQAVILSSYDCNGEGFIDWVRMKTPDTVRRMLTGVAFVQHSRPHLKQPAADCYVQGTGQAQNFSTFIQSSLCVNPGVF